ncbi:hypothetical protein [Herbaspirillum sp. alder98]|uniref:hypothetical protein n=1 Tax=Herbaspirillum sp. alder98 TaxID=2913096 RepID=UPI001CD90958|nr:hypothetical protein [Herbaspirillum sp. alder98]MCA1325611.1 hypothetical protein [Herbaspirillum sp. alder98]
MTLQITQQSYVTFHPKVDENSSSDDAKAKAKKAEPGSTTAPGTSKSAGQGKAASLRRDNDIRKMCEIYSKQFSELAPQAEAHAFYKEKFPSLADMDGRPLGDLLAELDLDKEQGNPNIKIRNKDDAQVDDIYAVYERAQDELRSNRIVTVEKQSADHNGIPASQNQGALRTVHIGVYVHTKGNPMRETQYQDPDQPLGEPEVMEWRAAANKPKPYMTLQPGFLNNEESRYTMWMRRNDDSPKGFLSQSLMAHTGQIEYSMSDLSKSFAPHTIEGRTNPKAGPLALDEHARGMAVKYGQQAFGDANWARNPANLHTSLREGGSCSTGVAKHIQGFDLFRLKSQAEAEWVAKGLPAEDAPTMDELVDKLEGLAQYNPVNQSPRTMFNNMLLSKVNGEFQYVFVGKSDQSQIANDREGPPPAGLKLAPLPDLPADDPRTFENVDAARKAKQIPRTESTQDNQATEAAKGK